MANYAAIRDVMTEAERCRLEADIEALVQGSHAGAVEITVEKIGARTGTNVGSGAATAATTSITMRAFYRVMEADIESGIAAGDRRYFLPVSLLVHPTTGAAIQPGAADRIVHGSDVYGVVMAERDAFGLIYHATARRHGAKP